MITYNYPGWTWWLKSNQFPTVSKWDIRWIKSSPVHHLLSNHLKPPMSCFFCSKKLAWCENYFLKSYQRGQLAEWCTVYETPVVKKKVSSVFNHSFQAINHIIEWSLQGRGQWKKKKKKKVLHNITYSIKKYNSLYSSSPPLVKRQKWKHQESNVAIFQPSIHFPFTHLCCQ